MRRRHSKGSARPRTRRRKSSRSSTERSTPALADANFKARLADLGGDGLPGTPADFAKLIAAETEKWGKVIKFAHIKPV